MEKELNQFSHGDQSEDGVVYLEGGKGMRSLRRTGKKKGEDRGL